MKFSFQLARFTRSCSKKMKFSFRPSLGFAELGNWKLRFIHCLWHGIATLGLWPRSRWQHPPLSLRGRSPKQSRANRVSSLKRRRSILWVREPQRSVEKKTQYSLSTRAAAKRWKEDAVFFEFGRSPQPYIGIATPSLSQRWGVAMTMKKEVCLLFNTSLRSYQWQRRSNYLTANGEQFSSQICKPLRNNLK